MTQTTKGLKQIRYREFLHLVLTAKGPFSYRFSGLQMICDPLIYIGRHYGTRTAFFQAMHGYVQGAPLRFETAPSHEDVYGSAR